jgi:large subunit ribosomal protein L25
MEKYMEIKAESRKEVGKKVAKRIRKEGKVPAIIYGGERETIPITITVDALKRIMKSEKKDNTVLRIQRDEVLVDAMLKEIQYDYLSQNIIHADFIRIDINQPVTVSVPIKCVGEPIGIRIEDGIFDFVNREVKITCLPALIPTMIELDVTELHAGHSIKAEALEVDEGLTIVSDPHTVICAVTARGAAEEELVEEEVEEGEEVAEGEEKGEAAEDKKEEKGEAKSEDKSEEKKE